jgi:hypothetical protein
MKAKIALLIAATILLMLSTQGCKPSPRWGYLANSGSPVPIKGTYFFVGDAKVDRSFYTFTPTDPQHHLQWSTNRDAPKWVLDMMKGVGINVVMMSYWGSDIGSAPMQSTPGSYEKLFDEAALDHQVLILPAVEVASGLTHHYGIQGDDFLQKRLMDIIDRFITHPRNPNWPAQWAKVYDQRGRPRYAVQLIGVASNSEIDDRAFVKWLDTVAESVSAGLSDPIGFMIDPGLPDTSVPLNYTPYTPKPGVTPFQNAESFLAIQGFISEIQTPGIEFCDAIPYCDNNGLLPPNHPDGAENESKREMIAAKKRMRLAGWINAGLPVVVDVNPGFDGHYVWGAAGKPTGYWGDNAFYYDDYFRNYMSQLRGMGNVGITFNSWNQYTEGSVGIPSSRVPVPNMGTTTGHWDSVQFRWLKDMYTPDPRECNHVHYVDGGLTKYYVYGAICEHWQTFGHDGMPPSVTFGAPTTSEMDTPGGHGRMNRFTKEPLRRRLIWRP